MLYIYQIKDLHPNFVSLLLGLITINKTYNFDLNDNSNIQSFIKKHTDKINSKISQSRNTLYYTVSIQSFNQNCKLNYDNYNIEKNSHSMGTIIINLGEDANERFLASSKMTKQLRDNRYKILSFIPKHLDCIAFDEDVTSNIYLNNKTSSNYLVINVYSLPQSFESFSSLLSNSNFISEEINEFYIEDIPQKDIEIIINDKNIHDPEFFLVTNNIKSNYIYFITDYSFYNSNEVTNTIYTDNKYQNINVDYLFENPLHYYNFTFTNNQKTLFSKLINFTSFPVVIRDDLNHSLTSNFDKLLQNFITTFFNNFNYGSTSDYYFAVSNVTNHFSECDKIIFFIEDTNDDVFIYNKNLLGNYSIFSKLFTNTPSMLLIDKNKKNNIVSCKSNKYLTMYILKRDIVTFEDLNYFNNIDSDNILDLSYNSIEEFNITPAKPLIFESDMSHFKNTDDFSDSSYNLLWEYDISYQELSKEYVINNCDYTISTEYLSNDLIESSCDYDEKQQIILNKILRFDSSIDQHSMSLLTKDISTLNFHDNNFLVTPETNKNLFFLYLKLFQNSIAPIIEKKHPVFEINLDSISIYRYNKDSKKKHNILPYKTILACFYLNDTTTDNSFDTILSKHFIDNPAGTLLIHTWMKKTIFKTNYTDYKYVLTYNISIT
jgi:hypothetical protein